VWAVAPLIIIIIFSLILISHMRTHAYAYFRASRGKVSGKQQTTCKSIIFLTEAQLIIRHIDIVNYPNNRLNVEVVNEFVYG
jgi:hypothetical protein